jgi:acetyl esterase/lipase
MLTTSFQACLYVLAHPEMYDVTKVSIGGTSAGACLALSTAAKLGPKKIQAVSRTDVYWRYSH